MKKLFYLMMTAALLCGCAKNESIESISNAKIHGSVVASGEPVNAAAILLTPGGGVKITGSDGMYEFADLTPGKYEMKVFKENFQSFNQTIDVSDGKDKEVTATLTKSAGKLSINKAYIDMGSNESDNVAGFSLVNGGDTELAWSITNAAGWITKIDPASGTIPANSQAGVVITIDRSKLSANTNENYANLVARSTTDGSIAEMLVTVFGIGDGTNTTISKGDFVVIGDLYVQTKDLGSGGLNWSSANSLCKNSVVGDFNDWRLPTIDELATIYTKKDAIGGFITEYDGGCYWSSSIFSIPYDEHYYMDFYSGSQSYDYYYTTCNARAVRKDVLPVVIVLSASNMSENGVMFNGKVTVAGSPAYTERGFVYGASHLPTMADTKVISYSSKSDSIFTATVNSLTMGTTYYVRTYAINKNTTVYSTDEISFTISNQKAQVSTLPVTDIAATSAVFNGTIDSKGIPAYTEKGFCYSSVFQNPTVDNDKKVVTGTGTGDFSANVADLTTGTTYYVRAYATNDEGTAYGSSVSFTASDPNYVVLSTAGIMVQKADINDSQLSWSSAKSLVENSTVGGYTDWRLPTRSELAVLYNERNAIGGFVTTGYYDSYTFYWSSEAYSGGYSWGIYFSSGSADWLYSGYARAVRTLP